MCKPREKAGVQVAEVKQVVEDGKPVDFPVTPGKILSLSSQERPALLVALLLRITSEGAGMVMPLLLAEAYDAVVDAYGSAEEAGATRDTLTRVFILALSLHVAGNVFGFLAGCATGVAGERVVSRLRRRLYDHLLTQEMSFFDSHKSGDLVSRLGADTLLVQQATTQALNECLVGLIKVLAGVVLMFIVSWQLTFIVFCSLLCWLCLVMNPLMRVIQRLTNRYQNALANAATVSTEALGAMRTVRSFAAETLEHDKYHRSVGTPANGGWWPARGETTYRSGVLKAIVSSALGGSGFLIIFGALNVSLWVGFVMITENNLRFGKLSAFQAYQIQVTRSGPLPPPAPPPPLSPLHLAGCCPVLPAHHVPYPAPDRHRHRAASGLCGAARAGQGRRREDLRASRQGARDPGLGRRGSRRDHAGRGQLQGGPLRLPDQPSAAGAAGALLLRPRCARGARTPKLRTAPATHTPDPRCGRVGSRLHHRPRRPERMRQVDGADSAHAHAAYVCMQNAHAPHTRPNAHAPHTRPTRAAHALRQRAQVLSLLMRFYEARGGVVAIDGHDVTSLDPAWLRSKLAFVQQEPVLFGVTVRENVAYALAAADARRARAGHLATAAPRTQAEREASLQARVEEACHKAHAHAYVSELPDGYDTLVGERGVKLSGGQKQRLAIARALLAQPRILLLDEATSALDAESERLVQKAIDEASAGRSVVVVAHRLSTVRDADQIAVMSQGVIADCGTHAELIESCDMYQTLVQRQMSGAPAAAPE